MVLLTAGIFATLATGCSSTSGQAGSSASVSSSASTAAADYTTIKPAEAKSRIDAGGVTVVDVRTQAEYDEGHIEGATLVPLDSIDGSPIAALPDKDATLVVYCRTGVRSARASAKLVEMGYTHVLNMDGGITAWTYGTVR